MMRKSPRRWTAEEDSILYREAMKQSPDSIWDWNRIAANFTDRSNKDCRKRWVNHVSGGLKKGPWSEEENSKLREAVQIFGQRWTVVADAVGCRSADQCAKRWQHHLDPQLNRKEWTKDEDEQLLQALQKMGRNWKSIRDQKFHGRSRNDVKNRYTILTRRASSSTSATTKRNTPDTESDEDDEHDRAFSVPEDDGEEEEDDDYDDEDGDNHNNNNNNKNNNNNNMIYDNGGDLRDTNIDFASKAAGQDTMDLGPFPTPLSSHDFGAATATMSPTEHAFSLPFSMDDIIDLDNAQVDHNYPFDPSPDQFDLLNMTHVEPSVNDMLGVDNKALWQEDSCISPVSCGRQSAGQSTYKRVTLVLEDYDKGLMDQLLHIVSTSQGKSQIEIMP